MYSSLGMPLAFHLTFRNWSLGLPVSIGMSLFLALATPKYFLFLPVQNWFLLLLLMVLEDGESACRRHGLSRPRC